MVNIGWDLGKQAHIHIPLVGVYTRAFWRKIDNIYQSYTADSDCSYEIKRCLLFERKAITNPYSILKSRGITLPTKVLLVKAMVFPVVTYGCESWTIKKAERRRIDAFELWCWRRLLRVPWNARRANQSIAKKSTLNVCWKDWCWSSSILATWCEELTHWKRLWCWEWLKAGGEGDDRGWDGWMASLTPWTWVWASSRSWWWTRKPGLLQFMELQRVRHNCETKQQQKWSKSERDRYHMISII